MLSAVQILQVCQCLCVISPKNPGCALLLDLAHRITNVTPHSNLERSHYFAYCGTQSTQQMSGSVRQQESKKGCKCWFEQLTALRRGSCGSCRADGDLYQRASVQGIGTHLLSAIKSSLLAQLYLALVSPLEIPLLAKLFPLVEQH